MNYWPDEVRGRFARPARREPPMTDRQLLDAFIHGGSPQDFAQIVRKYQDLVYGTCCRILGNAEDAEEAAQAVFVILWQKVGALGGRVNLAGWLYRTAGLTALNAAKVRRRRQVHERRAPFMGSAEQKDTEATWEEVRPHLDRALAALPAAQRESIVLRYLHDLSLEAVAESMSCPAGTVRIRLQRALDALRRRLRRDGVAVSGAALAAWLGAEAHAAAPPGFAAAVETACVGGGVAADSAVAQIAASTLKTMSWAKANLVAAGAAAILLGAAAINGSYWALSWNRADTPRVVTNAPKGEYQVAWLTLRNTWEGVEALPLMIGLRDGKAVTAWFCHPALSGGHHRPWADQVTLRLGGGRLRGLIGGRFISDWAPTTVKALYAIEVDARVDGARISGTATATVGAKRSNGTLTGTIRGESEMRTRYGLPANGAWPNYYGLGGLRGPDSGAAMVENLVDVQPVWKSEEATPVSWGNAPDQRYMDRAAVTGPGGGASSPVVADGLVFQFYYRPAGPVSIDESEVRRLAAGIDDSPLGIRDVRDAFRTRADDVIVALDAATGQTVWRTVLPDRAFNIQTHKWRGGDCTPCVADGKVFVMDYGRRLFALDARTGKLAWEYGALAIRDSNRAMNGIQAAGPMAADGVVVLAPGGPSLGLDARTGAVLWKGPEGNALLWSGGGAGRFIIGKACVEAKTGKVLWEMAAPINRNWLSAVVAEDRLVGFMPNPADRNRHEVICYRLTDGGAEKAWTVPGPIQRDTFGLTVLNGHVYLSGEKETRCIELESGKEIAKIEGVGGADNQVAFSAGGRVFIQPSGRYGGQSFYLLNADPANFRLYKTGSPPQGHFPAPDQWHPPHPHTTAHANFPIVSPFVDGRLFVRGADGIYCYDLRKE
jgi:RNA polymerase sigma factor (sigma-70 family)